MMMYPFVIPRHCATAQCDILQEMLKTVSFSCTRGFHLQRGKNLAGKTRKPAKRQICFVPTGSVSLIEDQAQESTPPPQVLILSSYHKTAVETQEAVLLNLI